MISQILFSFTCLSAKQIFKLAIHNVYTSSKVSAGHLCYFLIFSLMKNDIFAFSIKLIWLGVGF